MADFEVKVRNLETGEMLVASMPDAKTCIEWLKERPKNLEIVSVLSDVSPADSRRMKEAMRPYDKDELALREEYERKQTAAQMEQYGKELELIEGLQKEAKDESGLDPKRPLSVRYDADTGLTVVEDSRPITEKARKACMAWIDERNAWIAAKGQLVGEAHLEVWPDEIPGGDESERVLEGGRFFPRLVN